MVLCVVLDPGDDTGVCTFLRHFYPNGYKTHWYLYMFAVENSADQWKAENKLSTSGDLGPAGEFSWHGAARRGDVNRPNSGTLVS
jgi:hypothetical protein